MNPVKVTNLYKKFSGFEAVTNLSFEIEKNKVLGFLGPNGAGKTTTLRMLVGLSCPSKGKIEINGKEIIFGNNKGSELFGYLPEQPAFYNWMTGAEYLNFVADLFHLSPSTKLERTKKLFDLVGLTAAKNKRVGTYSNGMKQRLGIAQALINDSDVLILDEPVSALDPIGRKEILDIIENLKKEKTIIMSTHILGDVDRICDDIIILNKGRLVVSSSLYELKEKYTKPLLLVSFVSDPREIKILLNKEKWVETVSQLGNTLSISLKDEKDIESNLPLKYFAEKKIGVLKYGLTLPETEDLFIKLLEEK